MLNDPTRLLRRGIQKLRITRRRSPVNQISSSASPPVSNEGIPYTRRRSCNRDHRFNRILSERHAHLSYLPLLCSKGRKRATFSRRLANSAYNLWNVVGKNAQNRRIPRQPSFYLGNTSRDIMHRMVQTVYMLNMVVEIFVHRWHACELESDELPPLRTRRVQKLVEGLKDNLSMEGIHTLVDYLKFLRKDAEKIPLLNNSLNDIFGVVDDLVQNRVVENEILEEECEVLTKLAGCLSAAVTVLRETRNPLPSTVYKDLIFVAMNMSINEDPTRDPISFHKEFIYAMYHLPQESTIGESANKKQLIFSAHMGMLRVPHQSMIPNFAFVDGPLHRGGRPTIDGLLFLQDYNIDTVIDLCSDDGTDLREFINHRYYNIPIEIDEIPSTSKISKFVGLVDRLNNKGRRIFVFCSNGMWRTGLMVACWRVSQGMDVCEALKYETFMQLPIGEELCNAVRAFDLSLHVPPSLGTSGWAPSSVGSPNSSVRGNVSYGNSSEPPDSGSIQSEFLSARSTWGNGERFSLD